MILTRVFIFSGVFFFGYQFCVCDDISDGDDRDDGDDHNDTIYKNANDDNHIIKKSIKEV